MMMYMMQQKSLSLLRIQMVMLITLKTAKVSIKQSRPTHLFLADVNQSQSLSAAEHEECDCCESMRYRNFNHYRFMYSAYYPGSYFGNSFYRPVYGCDCCEDYSYYGSNDWFSFGYLGSAYSYYGFYDAWGNWHSYSPLAIHPGGMIHMAITHMLTGGIIMAGTTTQTIIGGIITA